MEKREKAVGLQPGGVNENQGAESTLAWLLSLVAVRSLEMDEKAEAGQSRSVGQNDALTVTS